MNNILCEIKGHDWVSAEWDGEVHRDEYCKYLNLRCLVCKVHAIYAIQEQPNVVDRSVVLVTTERE